MQIICKKMNKNVCQVAVKKEGIQETVQLITTEALTQLRKPVHDPEMSLP